MSIIYFFLVTSGLGYSFTRFLDNKKAETYIIRIGIGLAAIPVVGVILNLLHIPIDYRIFLILCLALPVVDLVKNRSKLTFLKLRFRVPKQRIIFLILILIYSLIIYCFGPFRYTWLEDNDPWAHAAGAKYIAFEKNLNVPSGEFHYINPYPPGYDLLMGILHQTSSSMYWTLKFFNGLIIVLGILFFYIFAKEFAENREKALWATFFLAAVPCYLSHFIWAHSLAITLFFPAFYIFLKSQKDKRFILPGAVVVAGVFLTQPTQSIKFVILGLIFFIIFLLVKKKLHKNLIAIFLLATLISLIWWGPVIKDMAGGSSKIAVRQERRATGYSPQTTAIAKGLFNPAGGTATSEYHFMDYFISTRSNYLNNPIGVGQILFLLALIGLLNILWRLYKDRKRDGDGREYYLTLLFWLLFTFLGMNSKTFHLPVGLFAFRFWSLFAIPVSFLAAEGVYSLVKHTTDLHLKTLIFAALIIGALCTSAYPKLQLNLGVWTHGSYFYTKEEARGLAWLRKNLPKNTKVFGFSENFLVIGQDMFVDSWSKEYKNAFGDAITFDVRRLHYLLKKHHFQYLVSREADVKNYGLDQTNKTWNALMDAPHLFKPVFEEKNTIFIFKIL